MQIAPQVISCGRDEALEIAEQRQRTASRRIASHSPRWEPLCGRASVRACSDHCVAPNRKGTDAGYTLELALRIPTRSPSDGQGT